MKAEYACERRSVFCFSSRRERHGKLIIRTIYKGDDRMKIFSFFSGSGFLDLGFETNGFDVAFVNEFDPEFMRAYQYARENMGIDPPEYGYYNGDVNVFLTDAERRDELSRNMEAIRVQGELVGFIGGPPCPDFSIAGKNRGREGDNGKLSLSYINLIVQRQPDFFLFENVKGLWSTKRHRAFFDELKEMIQKQAEYEKSEKERLHKGQSDTEIYRLELKMIDRMIESSKTWDGMHIVFHGIHQFAPLQLKFLEHLDELGVEVIFIYNYLPDFKEMYSSWNYIYQQFDAPIHHDQNVKTYIPVGQLQRPGNAIACNMAWLCEDGISRRERSIRENYKLYKNERVQEFDNISEYAGYVSDLFAFDTSIFFLTSFRL